MADELLVSGGGKISDEANVILERSDSRRGRRGTF
jgi:hypothetical protein